MAERTLALAALTAFPQTRDIEIRRGPDILSLGEAPLQPITFTPLSSLGIHLHILRGDLIHPLISGNKAWKLRDNLHEAIRLGKQQLVTFGGAYSNHLLAVAAAAHALRFQSVGILRGEEPFTNPLLDQVQILGMKLIRVSRENYRNKEELIHRLGLDQPGSFLLPEGGSNNLALAGCAENLPANPSFDHIILPVGTGGTLAGIALGAETKQPQAYVHGIAVLKGAEYLNQAVKKLAPGLRNWTIHHNHHFGGYAKTNTTLESLLAKFHLETTIQLESTYTGKALAGLLSIADSGVIPRGARVLFIHTGGLWLTQTSSRSIISPSF